MHDAESLIVELDAALNASTPEWRASTLRQVTDLFVDGATRYSLEHVALYDAVMSRLAAVVEPPSLVELSGRLAPIGNAPASTVSRLSQDDNIAVAGPILEQSEVLQDTDIAAVAKARGQAHLLAIAGRSRIDMSISDILIERGNPQVVQKILSNEGASFSEVGFVKLINEAKRDKSLATKIAGRADVPPELRSFLSLSLN